MRAAVYLRISDDREGREFAVERQRADCLTLAGRLGVDVVEVYQDNDAPASPRVRGRRPAYRRMLADADARRFGTVIAYTSSRLAHLPGEYEDLIELAQRRGTRFAYVVSASSQPDNAWPGASPLLPIIGALDTFRRLASDLAPDLRGLLADAAPAVEPLAAGVAGLVRNAMPGLRDLVRESTPFVTELSRALPPLGNALGGFLTRVSPGTAGASALVNDVISLATRQAVFWADVIRRLSQAYLTVRTTLPELPGDLGAAIAALPERTRHLVVSVFDRATTAVGIGIGQALRSIAEPPGRTWWDTGSLPDLVRARLTSMVDAANSAASALVGSATDILTNLPERLGSTARDIANSVIGGTESTARLTVAVVERAIRNLLLGVQRGLELPSPSATAALDHAVTDHAVTDHAVTDHAVTDAPAAPLGITVDGLNINLYGMGELTDSATFDRVAAGIYAALNRHRQEYA
jgi:hypothetical protein